MCTDGAIAKAERLNAAELTTIARSLKLGAAAASELVDDAVATSEWPALTSRGRRSR